LLFNRLTGFNASGIKGNSRRKRNQEATGMANETDDPEIAAARLEAALDRIAARRAVPAILAPPPKASDTAELAVRLDGLIDRLRGALATK
jgi:hypothetical protein